MATMIDGESYLGRVMIRPLSNSGDITLYLWPLRCLKSKMGGAAIGTRAAMTSWEPGDHTRKSPMAW